jgi:hypothetical protein
MIRIISWFDREGEMISTDPFYLQDAELRVTSILSLLPLNPPYLQGCDRYVLTCYGLLLSFVAERGFGLDVVESFRFFLAYEVLKIADMYQFLNADDTPRRFLKLDQSFIDATPNIMKQLSIHLALRWEMLFFW